MIQRVTIAELGIKLAALALIVLFQWQIWIKNDWVTQVQILRSKISSLNDENTAVLDSASRIQNEIDALNLSTERQEHVLRERLGFVGKDETFYRELHTD